MTTPILLDSGQSERGWHLLATGLTCPQLRAYGEMRKRKGADGKALLSWPEPEPLVRGGTAHIAMAHFFARLKCIQEGTNPDAFYGSRDAVSVYAAKQDSRWGDATPHPRTVFVGDVAEECSQCAEAFADWFMAGGLSGRWRVITVEEQFRALIQEGGWTLDAGVTEWLFTQRADLVFEDLSTGMIYILDWKTRRNKRDKRAQRAYIRSGQMQGYRMFGEQAWGDKFGGVIIGFLSFLGGPTKKEMRRLLEQGKTPHYKFSFELVDIPVLPHRLAGFIKTIRWGERLWQDCEQMCGTSDEDLWEYPKVGLDNGSCEHRYGECPGADYCDYGKQADLVIAEREAEWERDRR